MFDGSSGVEGSDLGLIAHRPGRLLAKSDRFRDSLEKAALFRFHGRVGRPAFHDFEREEAKESEPRKLEIQSKIFRDLRDRTDAVELRGELGFRDREPKLLHAL